MADDKYDTVEIPDDPAEYLNGPTGNTASRGTGGTTRGGHVQVVKVDDRSGEFSSGDTSSTGSGAGSA